MLKDNINKRTKIVVTLGPATNTYEQIKDLVLAGANMFRANTSHGTLENHLKEIKTVRAVAKELNLFLPILVDLQGPKIRIGELEHPIELTLGQQLVLSPVRSDIDNNIIKVDYKNIAQDVDENSRILIDDGKISLRVISCHEDEVLAEVVNPGILKSRKGLNIPGACTSLGAVTEKDVECIKFAVKNKVDYLALSFVRQKEDILLAKKYVEQFGGEIPVIAKIEKPQAVDNLVEIIHEADGVMVARGDLGIEISPERVPIVQKNILNEANSQRKVAIVATQMLETMIEQPIPTRAEASDVANAIIDGADAVMLSGETSVGKFAKESVAMMTSIAKNVEKSKFCDYDIELGININFELTAQSIMASAVKLANDVHAKAILVFTHTGYSTRFVSKLRSDVPVLAISDMEKTCRKLNLYWNITPFLRDWDTVFGRSILIKIDEFLFENTTLQKDDRIIITGSIPKLITGRTNFLRVHRLGATSSKDV